MSRLKMISAIIIATIALAALCVVPIMTFAAPAHSSAKHVNQETPTIGYYAFNSTIRQGQNRLAAITGGLTLTIRHSGDFFGKFVQIGKVYQNVNGKIVNGSWSLTIFQGNGVAINAAGTAVNSTEVAGTFQVFNSGKLASAGIWSALAAPGPASQLSLVVVGRVSSGPDSKLALTGPIILNATSLSVGKPVSGTLNLSDGTVYTVNASVDRLGHLEVNIGVGSKTWHVIGTGIPFYNGQLEAKGFSGSFVGPREHDSGTWVGTFFKFTLM